MATRVRYLSSAGIQQAEIPGIDALARALPSHWLLYAGFTCFPAQGHPFEIDALVVMDDRILVLELKHFNGVLKAKSDRWTVNTSPRGRPIALLTEKARKIKGLIGRHISSLTKASVDFAVVLTGSATPENLPADQQRFCWTLAQACGLATRSVRAALLQQPTLLHVKPCGLEMDFERMLGDTKIFEPTRMNWGGYVIEEENTFVHPRGAWTEHRAHQVRDGRMKALLRLWRFDLLPPGLNSPAMRRLIADREREVIAHLRESESWLVERSAVLAPIAAPEDEVLSQHHDLLTYPNHWTGFRRYLERNRESLTQQQRTDLATSLLNLVAELHAKGVSHRDIGAACVWIGSPTNVALTGFMSAQTTQNASVGEWLSTLRGYSADLPEDANPISPSIGPQRDVYQVAELVAEILFDEPVRDWSKADTTPAEWAPSVLASILAKATAIAPSERYNDAIALSQAFGEAFVDGPKGAETSRLDGFETTELPFVRWPNHQPPKQRGAKFVYEAVGDDGDARVVKFWPSAQRNVTGALDLAMLALFESVARLKASPVTGLAKIDEAMLSPMGPYLVGRKYAGLPLADWTPTTGEAFLECVIQICLAVRALHDLGLTHCDLSPANMIVSGDGPEITLTIVDLFDLSPTGEGRVRNLAYAPPAWELLSDQHVDRFAVVKIVRELAAKIELAVDHPIVVVCDGEIERRAVETLETLLDAARASLRRLRQPAVETIELTHPHLPNLTLETPEGIVWVSASNIGRGAWEYSVASTDKRLRFRVRGSTLENVSVETIKFWDLAGTGRQASLPMRLAMTRNDRARGFEQLVAKVAEAAPLTATAFGVPPRTLGLPVSQLWSRSIELEGELAPQIVIKGRPNGAENLGSYSYETDRDFDFGEESEVEVRAIVDGRMRKVGVLDLALLSSSQLVIQNQSIALRAGETVRLVDRRARISLERRRRAVTRIIRKEGQLPDLIEYFDPGCSRSPTVYDLSAQDDDLIKYGLNMGQKAAFRKILAEGPVGLLQGPPGTGKTRFIAALVHWLVTKGGARKVLLASQSHEAVNNAAEEMIKSFNRHGGRLDLLRIGARGLTDRLRPYHTTSLREGFEQRFTGALKTRLTAAANAAGVSRALLFDLIDIDQELAQPTVRLERTLRALTDEDLEADEARRLGRRARQQRKALEQAAKRFVERELDEDFEAFQPLVVEAQLGVLAKHPQATQADVANALRIIQLGHEWVDTLRSGHRNFDEFLAKTRSVVAGTCVGLGETRVKLEKTSFDWVIIDEAARCTASELAVPLQLGRRVLLVGDHLQLPPMVLEDLDAALEEDLPSVSREERRRSDFERAFTSEYGNEVGQVLEEQYRMPSKISALVSNIFYAPKGVKLVPSPDRVGDERFQRDFPVILSEEITWIDTSTAAGNEEQRRNRDRDTWNEAEIDAILRILQAIADDKTFVGRLTREEDPAIGVICMYKTQKYKLEEAFAQRPFSERFRRTVKIDTVDAYQGKQNKVIIVSLVRNNKARRPGYVREPNRCNVALSRAQERLFIVGARKMWEDGRCRSPMRAVLEMITGADGAAPLGVVQASEDLLQ